MLSPILFSLSLLLFVAAGAAGVGAVRLPAPARVRTLRLLLGAAAAAVLALLAVYAARQAGFPAATLFHSLLWVTFLLAAGGLGADAALRIPALSLGAAGAGALALAGALFLDRAGGAPEDILANGWIGLHVACMLLAYAAFALGFLAGALFLLQVSFLKRKRRLDLVAGLPSLETLDAIEARAVLAGFLFLTAGLLVGYQEQRVASAFAAGWRTDPKVLWTAGTWAAYLLVVIARQTPLLRGRKVATLTVLSFAFVVFTYFGANYLSAGFHNF